MHVEELGGNTSRRKVGWKRVPTRSWVGTRPDEILYKVTGGGALANFFSGVYVYIQKRERARERKYSEARFGKAFWVVHGGPGVHLGASGGVHL